jgi:putative endonuclease
LIPGFTRRYGVLYLVWFELHQTMPAAITRERQIKEWKWAWKIELIETLYPHWNDLAIGLGLAPIEVPQPGPRRSSG